MKAKKIISIVVAAVLIFATMMIPVSADAAYTFTATVDGVVKTGANFEVAISANVPANNGISTKISYDTEKLEYVSSEWVVAKVAANPNLVPTPGALEAYNGFGGPANAGDVILKITFKALVAAEDVAITLSKMDDMLNGSYEVVADADMAFNSATFDVVDAHVAPTFDVAITGTATSGETLTAAVSNFDDNWGLTADYAYQWKADGVAIDGATAETYALTAADYDKAISVAVTATVASDDDATNVVTVESAATAKVGVPATAPTLTVVETRDDVVAVGVALDTEATAEAAELVGGEATIAYSWKVDGTEVATTETYTPDMTAYGTGNSVVTCVVTATSVRNSATASKTVTFSKKIVAGNMKPEISNLTVSKDAPVVGDVLTVSYVFADVADTSYAGEDDTDASVVTWFIGDAEEGIEAAEYEVTASDIGKVIKAVVVAGSTDATPNTNLGLSAEDVVVGNTLEAATSAVAKNPAYKPEVKNVAFSAKKLVVGKKYTVSYEYADGNAVEDASTFAILVADTEDAKAEDWTAIEGFTGTAADLGVKEFKFDKDQLKKFVKIEVTVLNKDEVTGAEAKVYSDVYEVKKASSGSAGLTGPNLAAGGSAPVAPVDPSTPDAPVVEVNKDAIVLTINSNAVSVFGEAVENDVAPIIRNDRTMLPARIVAESLGAEVAWDEATKTVTITKGETVIVIVIDSDKATVNGEEVALDSAAFIENDRTYTPVRFIAEALGATVGWDDATKTVTITPAVVADEK